MLARRLHWTVFVVVALASCGGSKATRDAGGGAGGGGGTGGPQACSSVSPCGGTIAGNWHVTDSCLSLMEDLGAVCPGASADVTFTFAGTMTFNADQSYTASNMGGGTTTYHYPASCIPSGYTCTQYGQVLMSIGGYSSVDCTTDASNVCNCDAVTASASANETGTYSTSGTMLTTTHDGATSSAPYCVQGNTLYLKQAPGDGGAQVTGSIVLVRQ